MRVYVQMSVASLLVVAVSLMLGLGCSSDNPAVSSTPIESHQAEPSAKNGDPPPERNLIRNPGFEQGHIFWYIATDFWRLTDENPHSGDVCMRYAVPAGYNWPIGVICTSGYEIWLETGRTYRFSYWSRQDNPDNADQDCWVWCRVMCDGNAIHSPDPTTPSASWRPESSTFVSAASRPVYVEVWVSVDAYLSPAAVALDDFGLYLIR